MEYAEKKEKEITFEIKEHLGVIGEGRGWTRELNVVSWNGQVEKFDIREWDPTHNKMRKGVTMTKNELQSLYEILKELKLEEEPTEEIASA